MAVIGDRAGALNALASGGTAGLDAYKKAQQATADYQRQALDQALGGRGIASLNVPSGAADEVASVIKSRTQGYTDDAASGVNLAGQQIGYDSTALDAFLANQQRRLDQQRREAEQNMELSRIQHAGKVAAWQREANAYGSAGEGSDAIASWFAQLDQNEQDALVKGGAQVLQQQAGQNAQGTQSKLDSVRQRLLASAQKGLGVAQAQAGMDPNVPAALRKPAQMTEGQGKAMKALQDRLTRLQRMKESVDAQTRGNLQTGLADALATIRLRLPDYQQDAATRLGMDPLMAMGRYPNDEEAITARRKVLDEFDSYIPGASQLDAERAYNSDLDAVYRSEWEKQGLSWDANKDGAESAGMSPQQAGQFTQSQEFADAAAAANDWRTQTDLTAQERYAGFESEMREMFPGEENARFVNYLLGYFRNQILTGNRDIYSVTDGASGG